MPYYCTSCGGDTSTPHVNAECDECGMISKCHYAELAHSDRILCINGPLGGTYTKHYNMPHLTVPLPPSPNSTTTPPISYITYNRHTNYLTAESHFACSDADCLLWAKLKADGKIT